MIYTNQKNITRARPIYLQIIISYSLSILRLIFEICSPLSLLIGLVHKGMISVILNNAQAKTVCFFTIISISIILDCSLSILRLISEICASLSSFVGLVYVAS